MIVFVLVVMLGNDVIHEDLEFYDLNRCRYFSERLNSQPLIPDKNGKSKKMTAYCKPLTVTTN